MTERSKATVAGSARFLQTTAVWAAAVLASMALPAFAAAAPERQPDAVT